MKIIKKVLNHICEMHPKANLVKCEYKDGVCIATIFDKEHYQIKGHIDNGVMIIEEGVLNVQDLQRNGEN